MPGRHEVAEIRQGEVGLQGEALPGEGGASQVPDSGAPRVYGAVSVAGEQRLCLVRECAAQGVDRGEEEAELGSLRRGPV